MKNQSIVIIGGIIPAAGRTAFRVLKPAAAAMAALILALSAAESAAAADPNVSSQNTSTQNVNVVNTPTVTVGSLPPVSLSGTPTVNANVAFPASQGVTVTAAGPLTNVGRLPSKQVTLFTVPANFGCSSLLLESNTDGSGTCFDMANHPGEILIITDWFWFGQVTAGNTCPVNIESPPPGGRIFLSSAAVGAPDGFVSKSEHMVTGVKMTVNPAAVTSATCTNVQFTMQGYLLPNQ
jgi:hypothetical protein